MSTPSTFRIRKRKTIDTRLHKVYFFIWDGMYDYIPEKGPGWLWDALEGVETAAKWILCKVYGHEPIQDQCLKPEHDFCAWCSCLMPFLAHEGVDDENCES